MVYVARLNPDGWDLEAPDGTVIQSGNGYPVEEGDEALWETIVTHAQQNQGIYQVIATVADGLEIIDER